VGGGAMLQFRPNCSAIAGDVIAELIELWKAIRDNPEDTASQYEIRWQRLQKEGYETFYDIRNSFNVTRNPYDLLFLTRTCVNGLIRFNNSGEFNNSLHHTRPGISPNRLRPLICHWSQTIQKVDFVVADYRETLSNAKQGDLVFLDPPYAGTKGRYLPQKFNLDCFVAELEKLNKNGVSWILTFDGMAGNRSYNTTLPKVLYKVRLGFPTGNSPFTKLMKTGIDAVSESVYLNFDLPTEILNDFAEFIQ
jgi:DNA adenine methylase